GSLELAAVVGTSINLSFVFSSRRRHTRSKRDWSSDVCSSDLSSIQPSRLRPGNSATVIELEGTFFEPFRRSIGSNCCVAERAKEIGRASCRERGEGCGGAGSVKDQKRG